MDFARLLSRSALAIKGPRRDPVSARVRRVLVASLYDKPASLVFGVLAGIIASTMAAALANVAQIGAALGVLCVIGIARVALVYLMARKSTRMSTAMLEFTYEIGAFSYALALGSMAGLTLYFEAGAEARVMMVANALCYAVAVAARNAGRPTIAVGQLVLVCLPVVAGALADGTPGSLTLALTMLLLLPGSWMITLNTFKVLRDSISAAETSAQLARQMQTLACTDVVTGLANRAGLNRAMVEAMMEIGEDDRYALIWIDLDRFKEVNDLKGHPVGDMVLAETGRRLREVCGQDATIARFGGDEFVIFMPVQERTQAVRLASELHTAIMQPISAGEDRLEVRASLGVALLPEDGEDADTLMQNADQALYHAKVGGRGQTRLFDRAMTRDLVRRREIENELRRAIQRDELSVFYQPIIELETGRIRSFEALVRWFHPDKGELRPDEFIPVAEETGVIITLGNWITAQAARAAAQWPRDVHVSVNLSPLQLRAPGAALGIRNALREAGLEPSRLELEVTESLLIEDNQATDYFIEELSEIGVKFALDDFGTGYSSLGHINTFPLNSIKVDRSFISGRNAGRKSDAIIRAVAELGAALDIGIVAEGLETREQVEAVKAAGCTLGQGYYFSRALPDYLATMLLKQEHEREADGARRALG